MHSSCLKKLKYCDHPLISQLQCGNYDGEFTVRLTRATLPFIGSPVSTVYLTANHEPGSSS